MGARGKERRVCGMIVLYHYYFQCYMPDYLSVYNYKYANRGGSATQYFISASAKCNQLFAQYAGDL